MEGRDLGRLWRVSVLTTWSLRRRSGFGGVVTDAGRREDADLLVGEVSKWPDDVGFLDYGLAALQVALAEGRSVWEEEISPGLGQ
jgi:hypothetical protein